MDLLVKDLNNLYKELQSLETGVLKSIIEKIENDEYELEEEDSIEQLDHFLLLIIKLLIESYNNRDSVLATLMEAKVDKLFANVCVDFSYNFSTPVISSKLINQLKNEDLVKINKYIIKRFIITNDCLNRNPDEFMSFFENSSIYGDNYKFVYQFLHDRISQVSRRLLLPDTLEEDLVKINLIENDKAQIICNIIEENLVNLYTAQAYSMLIDLHERLDKLE